MAKPPLTKMIVTDDDEDLLAITRYALESLKGVEIKYLNSGEATISEAITFQPDLILLDMMMPHMNGVETLKAMRAIPSLTKTPVVFFTAKVQKTEISSYLEMGAVDVIIKPFDPMQLADTIQSIYQNIQ